MMCLRNKFVFFVCLVIICLDYGSSAVAISKSKRTHNDLENSIALIRGEDTFVYPTSAAEGEEAGGFHSRKRRELSDWFIAPNTRWCGRGNTAGNYNHLGGASSADKCCRRHDHCQLHIPGMTSKYDLFNYRPFTLSHCSCDRRFRTCLKMADNSDANMVGKLFFNVVQTQCFILRSEKVCTQRSADGICEQEEIKQKAYIKNNLKF